MLEDFVINKDLDFEDSELSILVSSFKNTFNHNQKSFVCICRDVYRIWSYCKGHYFQVKNSDEWCNSYQVLAKFGFDRKAVSRYKLCYEHFMYDYGFGDFGLNMYAQDFSPSKLFELSSLEKDTFMNLVENKKLKPEMTVKQIREFLKNLKNGVSETENVLESHKEEIKEEDIPLVYDPKIEYEYSYFESKTKNQLLNIVWELQKEYQKLIKEKKKK